ncbi:conserved hypothetical protein [Ricinus communis]|uniref:RNase H type-1 domain-containing protein n=1 Tax=Ricinus communis TaxID=3988 RepID=B9SG24_RICCO|nr:conserved hypothetical protein [Ricinus communis]
MVLLYGMLWVKSGTSGYKAYNGRTPVSLCWNPPPPDFFKLNTDGAVHQSCWHEYVGGLIKDTNDKWVACLSMNIGLCSITFAELWGGYQGLMLADSLGITNLMVEVDSMTVVCLLSHSHGWIKFTCSSHLGY